MGVKADKHGHPDMANLVKEIEDVLRSALGIAHHYQVIDQVCASIARHHQSYQDQGYIAAR